MRELRVGDYVIMSEAGMREYDNNTTSNPFNVVGKVASVLSYDAVHRYHVVWPLPVINCYREGDIELAFKEEDF